MKVANQGRTWTDLPEGLCPTYRHEHLLFGGTKQETRLTCEEYKRSFVDPVIRRATRTEWTCGPLTSCATEPPPNPNASGTSPHPPIVDEKPSGPPGGITSEGQAALKLEPPSCCGHPMVYLQPSIRYGCERCGKSVSALSLGATQDQSASGVTEEFPGAPWTCPACRNTRGPSDFDGLTTSKKWDTDCWACGSRSAPIHPVSQQVGALLDTKSVEARIAGLKAASAKVTATVRESVTFWDEASQDLADIARAVAWQEPNVDTTIAKGLLREKAYCRTIPGCLEAIERAQDTLNLLRDQIEDIKHRFGTPRVIDEAIRDAQSKAPK